MDNEKVYQMPFAKVYGLLLQKILKKGRTQEEFEQAVSWLTGYHPEELAGL